MIAENPHKELMRIVFEELSGGNSRPLVDHLAEDVRWTVKGRTRWSRTYQGRTAVLNELLRELGARLADRYRASARRIIAEGDLVVVEARGEARTKEGVEYNNEYCFIYRLEDGAIKEVTEYLDTELVTAALGATG